MHFMERMEGFRGKTAAVVGLGVSNAPLIRLLAKHGAIVTAYDKNEKLDKTPWESIGVKLCLGEDYLENLSGDFVFRTPGLRPDHPALEKCRENSSVMTSEMELFFETCPCPIIAVTGSDGKTTTTTLISEMLKAEGYTVHVGGNIGQPLLAGTGSMSPDDRAVLELSSFQLMDMSRSPGTAVITNIEPNHLDWHKDMDEYVYAKGNILRFQDIDAMAVLNGENKITSGMKGNGKTVYFGKNLIKDNIIGGILPISDILLKGWHNVENYMAAICAVKDIVSPEVVRHVAKTFAGVPHRNELVGEVGGVRYYNDSIGSSPSRTSATLRSHGQKVLLIAGGYDKQIPFEPLAEVLPETTKTVLLIGKTAPKIREAVEKTAGCPELLDAGDLKTAVEMAREIAKPGDTVLLSPACASFDQFRNFEERGNAFKAMVQEMMDGARSGV